MDSKTSRRICQLVSGIIVADDDLDPAEEAFVDRVFRKFGFDAKQRRTLFPIVDRDEAARALQALPHDTRDYTLAVLIEAASADGKIVDNERAFLESMAGALNLTNDELDARIEQQMNSLDSMIPSSVDFESQALPVLPHMPPLPVVVPPAGSDPQAEERPPATQPITEVPEAAEAPPPMEPEAAVVEAEANDTAVVEAEADETAVVEAEADETAVVEAEADDTAVVEAEADETAVDDTAADLGESTAIMPAPAIDDEQTIGSAADAPADSDGLTDSDGLADDDTLSDAATLQDGRVFAQDVAADVVIAPDEQPADEDEAASSIEDVDAGW